METRKYLLLVALALFICLPGKSQQLGNLKSDNITFERIGQNVYVTVNVPLRDYYIANKTTLFLEPVIWGNDRIVSLPKVALDDNSRMVQMSEKVYALQYFNEHENIRYTVNIPYEEWMDDSRLVFRNQLNQNGTSELHNYSGIVKYSLGSPNSNYAEPSQRKAQAQFLTSEGKSNFNLNAKSIELYYPSARSSDILGLKGNDEAISAICKEIDQIRNDKKYEFLGVYIISYSSPESMIADNSRLAEKRAADFKTYLQQQSNYPESYFKISSSEDWAGLIALINSDKSMPNRRQALDIINNVNDLREREQRLMSLAGGSTYNYMKEYFFPKLHKIECNIIYKKLN